MFGKENVEGGKVKFYDPVTAHDYEFFSFRGEPSRKAKFCTAI